MWIFYQQPILVSVIVFLPQTLASKSLCLPWDSYYRRAYILISSAPCQFQLLRGVQSKVSFLNFFQKFDLNHAISLKSLMPLCIKSTNITLKIMIKMLLTNKGKINYFYWFYIRVLLKSRQFSCLLINLTSLLHIRQHQYLFGHGGTDQSYSE